MAAQWWPCMASCTNVYFGKREHLQSIQYTEAHKRSRLCCRSGLRSFNGSFDTYPICILFSTVWTGQYWNHLLQPTWIQAVYSHCSPGKTKLNISTGDVCSIPNIWAHLNVKLQMHFEMHCENVLLTLSNVIPDVELQGFHTLVHLSSELVLLASVDDHHGWKTQPSRQIDSSK